MNEPDAPVPWFQWIHTHGYIVGFSYRKRFVYPHKPSSVASHYCVSKRLYRLAERLSGCRGGTEHDIRHQIEHRAYLIRKGLAE